MGCVVGGGGSVLLLLFDAFFFFVPLHGLLSLRETGRTGCACGFYASILSIAGALLMLPCELLFSAFFVAD